MNYCIPFYIKIHSAFSLAKLTIFKENTNDYILKKKKFGDGLVIKLCLKK
jgi:hypothetical protein